MFSLVDVLADFRILGGIVISLSSTPADVFKVSKLAFFINLYIAGQYRPAIDLCRMLTGFICRIWYLWRNVDRLKLSSTPAGVFSLVSWED